MPQPASNKDSTIDSGNVTNSQASPRSADSEEDVNAYAEAKALSMESGMLQVQEQSDTNVANTELPHTEIRSGQQVADSPLPVRASTPIPIDAAGTSQASLTALELGLRVANTIGSQLPKLLTTRPTEVAVPPSVRYPLMMIASPLFMGFPPFRHKNTRYGS